VPGFEPSSGRYGTTPRRRRDDYERDVERSYDRDGRGSGERGRGAYAALPRKEKIDPWFLKPYEPSESTASTANGSEPAPAKNSSIKPSKTKVAALLGGGPKR
jgi:hypothetical protein